MKAIILEKPEHFTYADIDEPAQPGLGEALVEVHRVGICGTDVSGYLGKMPFFTYPCLLYTSPSPRDKRQSRMPSSA